jgi:ribosomal protein S18 acetylase RimI-like enzyme
MSITLEAVTEVTPELLTALRSLLRQLNFHLPESEQPVLSDSQLARVVAEPGSVLLVARTDAGQIIGTTTVALFDTPTGRRAWIEDVVVDGSARGQGVGEALTREAVRVADESGADHVDLTSASYREAANRLYPRVGFERRDTNVYRLNFKRR